jgi:ABC-type sugar transport system permease subunit
MSEEWFIRRGEERLGPLSQREFDELRKRGQIRNDDCVCTTWGTWQRFAEAKHEFSDQVFLETPEGFKPLPLKEALAFLVDEHLQSIELPPRERWRYQYVRLLHDLLRVVENNTTPQTEASLRQAVSEASYLIENFSSACQRNDNRGDPLPDVPERCREIWRHRNLQRAFEEGFTSKEACPMDRENIGYIAVHYLGQDLRSSMFEVLLVDALVAMEVYAYGEALKQNPSRYVKRFTLDQLGRVMNELDAYEEAKGKLDKLYWAWMKNTLKWAVIRGALVYAAPMGIAWFALENKWGDIAFAAVAFVVLLVGYRTISWGWRKLRSLFQRPEKEPLERAFELHAKMVIAYGELNGGTAASPRRIREVLAKVADEGAAWDPGVFSLLDVAIARSTGNWG